MFVDLQMSDEQLKNYALAEIEKILHRNGSTLRRFQSMPLPDNIMISEGMNKLIQEELRYDREQLREENMRFISSFTTEQRGVYDDVMNAVSRGQGGVFFLYGYGGTGKTFIWRSLSAGIRCKGGIVLTVASSGIASLLLPGGRTAHSRFAIPINIYEDSMCNIKPRSSLAELIGKAELIIWDEAPMTNKHCFEALDRSLRDVLRNSSSSSSLLPFARKVIVFGGDFRQILPILPKGTRNDIVSASLNSSYLWAHCKVLRLTRNMRLQGGRTESDMQKLREFSEWILSVGDGTIGDSDDGEANIEIPDDLCIKESGNPIASIVEEIYPYVVDRLSDGKYFEERTILAPTLEVVEKVNDFVMSLLPGEEKIYFSSDSISQIDGNGEHDTDIYSTEYLNSIKLSGIPNHCLKLKIGVPVMLLRNIDQSSGLCNGTRLVVTRLMTHTIEAEIISGIYILLVHSFYFNNVIFSSCR